MSTSSAPSRFAARAEIAPSAGRVLALVLGAASPHPNEAPFREFHLPSPDDWRAVYEIAFAERLAPLAWLRSGDAIRAEAPPDVQSRWRSYVVALHERGERQLALLVDAIRVMEQGGVQPIVLKGLPLAARLYGARDHWIRATADADFFVEPGERVAARAALVGQGWRPFAGGTPHEEAFVRDGTGEGERFFIELHSALQDDRHAHLPAVRPESAMIMVGDVALRAHTGPLVPAYLAAHLAKHRLAPLLWLVDFATLWSALPESDRALARGAARQVRLERYLTWAIGRADLLAPAAKGNTDALRSLGFSGAVRKDEHPLYRDLKLAHDAPDALRSLGAWLWPVPLRSNWRGMVGRWRSRLQKGLGSYSRATTRYDGTPRSPTRSL